MTGTIGIRRALCKRQGFQVAGIPTSAFSGPIHRLSSPLVAHRKKATCISSVQGNGFAERMGPGFWDLQRVVPAEGSAAPGAAPASELAGPHG